MVNSPKPVVMSAAKVSGRSFNIQTTLPWRPTDRPDMIVD